MTAPARLGPGDAAGAAALHAAAMDAPWSEDSFRELLQNPVIVAHGCRADDGSLCALLLIRALPGEAEIYTIAVASDRRRRGLAAALLAHGLATAAAQGVESVFLEVDEGNAPARRLYEKFGFTAVGRRKGYYGSSTGADAIVMRLDLSEASSAA